MAKEKQEVMKRDSESEESVEEQSQILDLEKGKQSDSESESEIGLWAPGRGKTKRTTSLSEFDIPGLWPSSFDDEYCCIYRVPSRFRKLNPEAYTPQMVLIGPLHHAKKNKPRDLFKSHQHYDDDLRYMDYMNMEHHKTKYLNAFEKKYGDQIVENFTTIIRTKEKRIRKSYAEPTKWIKSDEFVEMMLLDSVFIIGFFIQTIISKDLNKKGDILFKEPCLTTTILEDLILLENQIPYQLLEELYESSSSTLDTTETFRNITLRVFGFERKIKAEAKFKHFTDLARLVRVKTLDLKSEEKNSDVYRHPPMNKIFHNVDELDSAGVEFKSIDNEDNVSMKISFKRGALKMPCLTVEDNTEKIMRNLMALEQCHYPNAAYVCDFMVFLDLLIDTENDVNLLIKKGVIKNWLGQDKSVANMVNKLCLGMITSESYYYPIAEKLSKHYDNRLNRSVATLRRVYFKDLWTGTATVAAVVIVVLTLIGTVASVLQVTQNNNNSTSSPPST